MCNFCTLRISCNGNEEADRFICQNRLASDLIKSAKKTIILIDNYIDESVLTLLSKRY
jgi:hypothetical protein